MELHRLALMLIGMTPSNRDWWKTIIKHAPRHLSCFHTSIWGNTHGRRRGWQTPQLLRNSALPERACPGV